MTLLEQIAADLDTFFDTEGGFAEEITFSGTHGPYTISAIWDEGSTVVNDYAGGVDAIQPTALVKTADLKGIEKPHDQVRKGLVTYEIIEIRPGAGYGTTGLVLNEIRRD